MPNYKPKQCAICGETFTPLSGRSKYCGEKCREENDRRLDRESYQRHRLSRLEKEKKRRKSKPPRKLVCKYCQEEFETKTNAKFCSRKCLDQYWREARSQPGPIRDAKLEADTARYRKKVSTPEGREHVNEQSRQARDRYKEKHGISKSTADRNKNPDRAFHANLRSRLHQWLDSNGATKDHSLEEYVGCTLKELKAWIRKQWAPGMNWHNLGRESNDWQLDHVRPLASFTEEQAMTSWNWRNLQPLWKQDNNAKSDKYEPKDEQRWVQRMNQLGWTGPLYLKYSDAD